MRSACLIACIGALLSLPATTAGAQERAAAFDAPKAWAEFATLLHEHYGYYARSGVDGERILAAFADRARTAPDDKAFINVLQHVAHNFADPHFVVGPLDSEDWAIVPTASDLFGRYDGGSFVITDVRENGDAAARGVRPGMTVVRVEGLTPRAAVEDVTGRRFAELSAPQIEFAFNVALAGHRKRARTLELADGGRQRPFALAASNDLAQRIEDGPLLTVERHGRTGVIRINNSLGDQKLIAAFGAALAGLSDTNTLLIDLRNTPSGGNTSVARGIMGHFVDHDRPYQMHVVPFETRVLGPMRKFVEYVAPFGTRYPGTVYVAGGRWTGSMGEGLMIGFDAVGATTVGSMMAHLLGALDNATIAGSGATIDLGTEQLFTVTGLPRESYRPTLYLDHAERTAQGDSVLAAIAR